MEKRRRAGLLEALRALRCIPGKMKERLSKTEEPRSTRLAGFGFSVGWAAPTMVFIRGRYDWLSRHLFHASRLQSSKMRDVGLGGKDSSRKPKRRPKRLFLLHTRFKVLTISQNTPSIIGGRLDLRIAYIKLLRLPLLGNMVIYGK
jgi:hypothetical protein